MRAVHRWLFVAMLLLAGLLAGCAADWRMPALPGPLAGSVANMNMPAVSGLLDGSAAGGDMQAVAGLRPLPGDALRDWNVPENIMQDGNGNSVRLVGGPSLGADAALELAAGGQGSVVYFREGPASVAAQAGFRLQFLSTQGVGRVKLSALDGAGKELASQGWVFTGPVPPGDAATSWKDVRYQANYVGDWLKAVYTPAELFKKISAAAGAARYRLSIEAGQGQHALITEAYIADNPALAVRLTAMTADLTLALGSMAQVPVELENVSGIRLENVTVEFAEPFGHGLVAAEGGRQTLAVMEPGEKRRLSLIIKAQRPDAVNRGKPWQGGFKINGAPVGSPIRVAVSDPRPGTIFYVLTDDLEPIDSAGYRAAWGNADGWLQPEELRVQMVAKAEAANAIAERHGARWTHYIAWPVVKAAEWAAGQSGTGQWQDAVRMISNSVREQAARGHEYGIHLHCDYDPYLPGNVLSYNAAADGLWANHLRHGWAHSLAAEGTFEQYASRAGTLYAYQRIMDELAAGSPQGQLLTARVGSFDFGNGPEAESSGTRIYRKVGLWGGSDADGNSGGITAGDYEQGVYLAKYDDINTAAVDIAGTGLVEFRPTPREFINYDSQTAEQMDRKVDDGFARFAAGGAVKPGVHAIVGFTHIMFMLGEGDWRSTQGGQFAALNGHLRYVKERYAEAGLLRFGTASELVRAYLDYYAPQPVAVYGPRRSGLPGVAEYPIIILGRDIPVDAAHPHSLRVKYPLYLRDSAYRIMVLKNGMPIYATWGLPTPDNDIVFTADDASAVYSMKIYHNEYMAKVFSFLRQLKAGIGKGI